MAESGNQGGIGMWPSEATASRLYDIANIALIAALVIGVIATALVVWMGNVKEGYLKLDLARVNNEAAQAKLEQERLKTQLAWRDITPQQAKLISDSLRKTPMEITIAWISGDAEGSEFSRRLAQVILGAGSRVTAFAPFGIFGKEPHGLSISGSEREEVEALARALEAGGLKPSDIQISDRKPDGTKYFTHLFIGYREAPVIIGVQQ